MPRLSAPAIVGEERGLLKDFAARDYYLILLILAYLEEHLHLTPGDYGFSAPAHETVWGPDTHTILLHLLQHIRSPPKLAMMTKFRDSVASLIKFEVRSSQLLTHLRLDANEENPLFLRHDIDNLMYDRSTLQVTILATIRCVLRT